MASVLGRERLYNREYAKMGMEEVVSWDVLNIANEQELYLEFIRTNSKYRQGVRLAIDAGEGYIEINGIRAKEMFLWEDTAPQKVPIRCFSSEGVLSIYNCFDLGRDKGGRRTLTDSCGMLVESTENVIVYKCNDTGFQGVFDKLIFQIELL